jgi:arylsulfatase A-like enzyme
VGEGDRRPNLVLFMPDQLRADALGCFGNPAARTPAVDALAARGTRFTNAWGQHPVCGPSRVSMLTGWYPHTSGHRTLDNLLKPWEPNLLALLRDAGYHVAMAGNRGDVFAPGVTEASTDFCGLLVEPDPDDLARAWTADHPSDHPLHRAFYFGRAGDEPIVDTDEALIRTAEQWLVEGAPTDRPWVLWVPLLYPHPPFTVGDPWFSLHDRADMATPLPPDAAVGKAGFVEAYREIYGWDDLTVDDLREIAATYYGMVSRTDDQLRRLVETVERIAQADRTGWVYFTDHGEYLGDYGLVEKWPSGLDPQLTANPLVISLPGFPEGNVVTSPVEMVDLLPTLLELADTEASHTHFGRSLVPLLRDGSSPHRDAAVSEGGFRTSDDHLLESAGWIYEPKARLQHERTELVGLATCIRTDRWSFVHRLYEGDELYDRVADPAETTNLIGDPSHSDTVTALRSRLTDWFVETSDVFPWQPDPRNPETPQGWR